MSELKEPCPHTLCEHLGEGKMRCQRCGAIEPMVVTTMRVKAEDYEQLQRLFRLSRSLMQAQHIEVFNSTLEQIGELVGISPNIESARKRERVGLFSVFDAAKMWLASFRPREWTIEEHSSHPHVNMPRQSEHHLADALFSSGLPLD